MNLNDVVMFSVKRNECTISFQHMIKAEAINLLTNGDLSEKVEHNKT